MKVSVTLCVPGAFIIVFVYWRKEHGATARCCRIRTCEVRKMRFVLSSEEKISLHTSASVAKWLYFLKEGTDLGFRNLPDAEELANVNQLPVVAKKSRNLLATSQVIQ